MFSVHPSTSAQTPLIEQVCWSDAYSCPDAVQEAFNVGGRGYVVKTRAAIDLLAAIEEVLEGRQFVSSGVIAVDPSC